MTNKLQKLLASAENAVLGAKDLVSLEGARIKYFGRKSELSKIMGGLKDLPEGERAETGQIANEVRQKIQKLIEDKKCELEECEIGKKLAGEKLDISAPGLKIPRGHRHPLTIIRDQIAG